MKRIILVVTLMVVFAKLFGYFEYGVGMGFANNYITKNEKLDSVKGTNKFEIDIDLRHGFQLSHNNPFYLIYDLKTGYGIQIDEYAPFRTRLDRTIVEYGDFKAKISIWNLCITPGVMYKPNDKAKVSATFGWVGEHVSAEIEEEHGLFLENYEINLKAFTFRLSGDIDLSNSSAILMLGTNFDHFSWVPDQKYNVDKEIGNIFEYSLRAGMKFDDYPIYVFCVLSQELSNSSHRVLIGNGTYSYYDKFDSKSNTVYYGPELVFLPFPKLQFSASVGLMNITDKNKQTSPISENNHSSKTKEQGSIVELATEYNMNISSNGFIIGLKYLNSTDYAYKSESMLYHGIFTYFRWENAQRRNNNRIPYLSSGMGKNIFNTGIPSNGSIFKYD